MSLAVQIRQHGGPEELHIVDVPVGEPGPGEVRIRHHAIGLNFIDVYQRTGLYANPLPLALGMEGAGVVEAVGEGVTGFAPGERVLFAGALRGVAVSADQLQRALRSPTFVEEMDRAREQIRAEFNLDRTVAVVENQVILQSELDQAVAQARQQLASRQQTPASPRLSFNAPTQRHIPPLSANLSISRPSASRPPINSATTTEVPVMVML